MFLENLRYIFARSGQSRIVGARLFLLAFVILFSANALADSIKLKDGSAVSGNVIRVIPAQVEIKVGNGSIVLPFDKLSTEAQDSALGKKAVATPTPVVAKVATPTPRPTPAESALDQYQDVAISLIRPALKERTTDEKFKFPSSAKIEVEILFTGKVGKVHTLQTDVREPLLEIVLESAIIACEFPPFPPELMKEAGKSITLTVDVSASFSTTFEVVKGPPVN